MIDVSQDSTLKHCTVVTTAGPARAGVQSGVLVPFGTATVPETHGSIMCAVGDSLTANGYGYSAPNYQIKQYCGALAWGQAFLSHRIWMPVGIDNAGTQTSKLMFAVGGVTTQHVIDNQLSGALASRAGWANVRIGINDLVSLKTDSVATVCARLLRIVDAFRRAGKRVILWTLNPRSATGAGVGSWDQSGLSAGEVTTARLKQQAINSWIRTVCERTPGVVLCDPYWMFVDPASSTDDPLSGYTADGLHDSAKGAFVAGKVFRDAVSPFLPPVNSLAPGVADVYDATSNPYGNFYGSTAMLQGTGGTVGTGGTGNAATGWTVSRLNGSTTTFACAAQTRADGKNGREQEIVVTGEADDQLRLFYSSTLSTGDFAVGDWCYLDWEVAISSPTGNNQGVTAYWRHAADPAATVYTAQGLALDSAPSYLPVEAWSGSIRSPLMQIRAGFGPPVAWLQINTNTNGDWTLKAMRPTFRKLDVTLPGALIPGIDI